MAKRKPDDSRLETYREKRDFSRTSEPAGGGRARTESGRAFVVQKHDASRLHYDFRLEFDGVLKSWAVPRGPSLDPSQKLLAVHTEDHPIEYGDFEGVIPTGEYGGGTVMLWDRGEWEPLGDAIDGYEKGDLKFRLKGTKLHGDWVLARMTGEQSDGGKNWLLIKKRDDAARDVRTFNVLAEAPRSALSGRTLEEIAADPEAVWTDGGAEVTETGARAQAARGEEPGRARPGAIPAAASLPGARAGVPKLPFRPQLAMPVSMPPDGDAWLHEIKLDGYRLLSRIEDGRVRMFTRNGHDWTDRFGTLVRALERLPITDALLDGEVVILDRTGISDFGALQNAIRGWGNAALTYFVFDVPFADGQDLRRVPLLERKVYLKAILDAAPLAAPSVRYSDHIVGRGQVVFDHAADAGLEGIISKRATSHYESRRADSWLKVKCTLRQEFVIGGFTDPSGSRSGFGALLLGHYDAAGRLEYCGRVGTGYSNHDLTAIAKLLVPLVREDPAYRNPEADPEHRSPALHWVEPELVCEVEFNEWTSEGLVRHPVFKGLREDVEPRDVMRESADVRIPEPKRVRSRESVVRAHAGAPAAGEVIVAGVRISHPERTVYPEAAVTKREVAEYYALVATRMLEHIGDRPLSIVRCPMGLVGDAFYQRELGEGWPKALRGLEVDDDHAILVPNVEALVGLAQMGTLEIHAWGSRADQPGKPDRLVFDLDPGDGIEWPHVVAAATVVRDYLANLGLESFVKTTGGRGAHLVVPVVRRLAWAEAKAFCKGVADDLARMAPRNFVSTMSKRERKGRIFIDYLRNQQGSTAVAVYSTRARKGATVSAPLSWDEFTPELTPKMLTVRTVPGREDGWAGFFETRQSITKKMREAVEAT